MLSEAFAYPRDREGATRDLLVGGALVLASPLVVPLLVVLGYQLRVMDEAARGRDTPPVLGDWDRLVAGGLKAAVVWGFYGLVPMVLALGPPVGAWFALGPGGLRGLPQPQQLALVSVVAVLWLLAAVLALHLGAALVAVATQGRLGAAFQTDALWAVVATKQYLVGVVLAAVVAVGGGVLAALFAPVLLGFVVQFHVVVAVGYLLGRAVGGAAVTAIEVA